MSDWKELWNKNYRGEGNTAELSSFIKTLDYGSRKNVSYLPWAVVIRIFEFQDGTYELLKNTTGESIVEVDKMHVRDEIEDNGQIIPKYMTSYFLNIKATWNGRTHIERYPLQDNNGRAVSTWNQDILHKSTLRGIVKAIARVSGIGYKLFEDGDLQFESDEDKSEKAATPEEKAKKLNKPATEVVEKPKTKTEVKAEEKKKTTEELFPESIEKETEEVKINTSLPAKNVMLDEIRQQYLTGGKDKADTIKAFLKEANTIKLSDLEDEKIKALYLKVCVQ
jgi:hypothetical protein